MSMDTMSVRQARQKFAEIIKKAEAGGSVVITRRGRRVAKVVPTAEPKRRGLPDLSAFRASLGKIKNRPEATIQALRANERY
jgi:prevent-host-death family protein